ncbi:MAG: GspH/FimT family pseudopilin [Woeseiaceae bacterium]|nr:GspH/FimT family pseudopilin [Woeseiaceae bacterium]
MTQTTQGGFTLYELMITVLIAGIILALGVPNLQDFRANARMTSAVNDLHSAFHMARTEAARARQNVTICASPNPLAADSDCGGTFADGWIVFEDTDGDITRDAGEALLRSHPPIPAQISISTPGMGQYFSFAPTGLGRGDVTGQPPVTTAVLCDERGNVRAIGANSAARVLVVTPLGRPTVIREKNRIDTLIGISGATCP